MEGSSSGSFGGESDCSHDTQCAVMGSKEVHKCNTDTGLEISSHRYPQTRVLYMNKYCTCKKGEYAEVNPKDK